jgi:hypothetical protein
MRGSLGVVILADDVATVLQRGIEEWDYAMK